MPRIPAYCHDCNVWTATGIVIDNSTDIRISNQFYPCKKCGKQIEVTSGVYDIINGVIEVIKAGDLKAGELEELSRILQDAVRRNKPAGQIREIIARHPKASAFNKYLTEGGNFHDHLNKLIAVLAIASAIYFGMPDADAIADKVAERLAAETPKPHRFAPGPSERVPVTPNNRDKQPKQKVRLRQKKNKQKH